MQQLQDASDQRGCAREVLETIMAVITQVREAAARRPRRKGAPSLIQLRAMNVVRKRPGASLSVVSSHLALTLSATSRLVDTLAARRYLARTVCAENRRCVALTLTAKGARVLEAALRETEKELAQRLAGLTRGQQDSVCSAMHLIRTCVEESISPLGKLPKTVRLQARRSL
jgi:DNA-binding MarR family transcriptional regulator